ncbi:MAG TPA: NADH:flavin oxidoreductase, partial [Burkholderiales bacterium]|nr:NADH:flavin oxidoreductase [Burkholderiales bacterium]
MNSHFPRLFEPIRIGVKTARNRVMRLATTTNTGAEGVASARTVAFYRNVARGGSGTLITESMRVHPNGGRDGAMLAYRREIVPGLAQLADAVHAEGSLIVVQLNHGGRQHHSNSPPTLWGPSAIACPHSGGIPHEITRAEIAELVQGFAVSARHARESGMDGVEVHGAQGHLIQEFISPFSNRRGDEYGGSLNNRLRFVREILSAVRETIGPDLIVGYRMGVEEFAAGGITIDDSIEIAQRLAAFGVIDYLSLAQGT